MTIRRIAARPERNSQGLWIGVTCGVSVIAPAHELLSLVLRIGNEPRVRDGYIS